MDLPAEMIGKVLYWLDSRDDWRWLVLLFAAQYGHGLARPPPLMSEYELLDHRQEAFALAKHGDTDQPGDERLSRLAAKAGHLRAYRRHAVRTPDNMERDMVVAARHGHLEIVRQLHAWGCATGEHAKYAASYGRHVEVLDQLVKWSGGGIWNLTYVSGSRDSHLDRVGDRVSAFARKRGVVERNIAIMNGDVKTLRLIRLWMGSSAKNNNVSMRIAARFGQLEVLRRLKEWGADNFETSLHDAALHGQHEVAALLRNWIAET